MTMRLEEVYGNMENQNRTSNEEVVEHVFDSQNELLDMIMEQDGVFKAIALAKEINELNEYGVIGEYEMKVIKDSYKKRDAESGEYGIRKIKFVETISENSKSNFTNGILTSEKSKLGNYKSISYKSNSNTYKRELHQDDSVDSNIKTEKSKSDSPESKMRDLQKAYMKLMSQ